MKKMDKQSNLSARIDMMRICHKMLIQTELKKFQKSETSTVENDFMTRYKGMDSLNANLNPKEKLDLMLELDSLQRVDNAKSSKVNFEDKLNRFNALNTKIFEQCINSNDFTMRSETPNRKRKFDLLYKPDHKQIVQSSDLKLVKSLKNIDEKDDVQIFDKSALQIDEVNLNNQDQVFFKPEELGTAIFKSFKFHPMKNSMSTKKQYLQPKFYSIEKPEQKANLETNSASAQNISFLDQISENSDQATKVIQDTKKCAEDSGEILDDNI